MQTSKPNIIVEKTLQFSLSIITYVELLESKRKYVIANQLLKSGTSAGANVREAQNAESKADFIHKLKIAAKETDETIYWLIFGPFRGKTVSRKNFFAQTVFSGLDSIVIVCFVDFFIGMVLAMQSAYQLEQMGATIYVAIADSAAESQVSKGENTGRTLKHVAVVRSLSVVGSVGSGEFSKEVELKIPAGAGGNGLRVVAFVQDRATGRVLGIAQQKM